MSKNLGYLSGRKGLNKNLFEELSKAAASSGTPSQEDLDQIRDEFLVGKASVLGTVTFYDFLRPENQGKKVYVCNGSACMTAGTQAVLKSKLSGKFNEAEIGEMCCLGRCHENSAFHIDQHNYSGTDIDSIDNIISRHTLSVEKYHVDHIGTPVLTASCPAPASYYSLFEKALKNNPELRTNVIELLTLKLLYNKELLELKQKLDSAENELKKEKFFDAGSEE